MSTVEHTMLSSKPGPWYVPNWREIVDLVTSAVQSALTGDVPASLALQQIAGPVEHILTEGRDDMIPGF